MNFEVIKAWFERWNEKQIKSCRLKGIIGFSLTPIALLVASILVYWLLRIFLHDDANNLADPKPCLWITLGIIPVLFIANRFTPRRNLMEERMAEGPDDSFAARAATRRTVIVYFFLWILFTGPRLLDWGLDSFRKIKTWKAMDTRSCAAVLWLLLSRPRKVPYTDVQKELDWLNMEAVLPELAEILGILFLKSPPPGLALTQEFRDTVRNELSTGA